MTIYFEIAWWLLPVAVTVAAFAYAARDYEAENPAALIVSLIAWLVWSLAT